MFLALVLNSIQLCRMHYYYNYFTDEKIVNLFIKQQGCSDVGIQRRESARESTASSTSPADVPHIPHADSLGGEGGNSHRTEAAVVTWGRQGAERNGCVRTAVLGLVWKKKQLEWKIKGQSPREPTERFKYHTKTSIRLYTCVTRVLFFCIQYRQEKVTFYQKWKLKLLNKQE